jgi:signal transduction histidine kinase
MRVDASTLVALFIAAAALALRTARSGFPGLTPESLPLLFIAACLCSVPLLRRSVPAAAWLAAVVAGGLAAIEVAGSVRGLKTSANAEAWPWLVAVAELALVGAAGIASAYAIKGAPSPPPWSTRVWRVLVVAALVVVGASGAWVVALAFAGELPASTAQVDGADISGLRLSGRLIIGFVAIAVVVGIWRDLSEPVRRGRSNAQGVADMPRAVAEQLLPNASTFHRRGREEERARLAADLHALVLPDLRRAARTAEASGDAGQPLVADLRNAVEGVERLMHGRQSVVVEAFGLVAALEWLAERTQDQGPDVVVELGGVRDDPDVLPKPVTRAAFRVAILAVDNVLRHAAASHLELGLETRHGALALSIVDDGRGASPPSRSREGRGLADIRAAASEVGASIDVRSSPEGTSVAFRWAGAGGAAGDHATKASDPPDIPNTPVP